jgi:hypothetical protein
LKNRGDERSLAPVSKLETGNGLPNEAPSLKFIPIERRDCTKLGVARNLAKHNDGDRREMDLKLSGKRPRTRD